MGKDEKSKINKKSGSSSLREGRIPLVTNEQITTIIDLMLTLKFRIHFVEVIRLV